jgi:hypothetical protein
MKALVAAPTADDEDVQVELSRMITLYYRSSTLSQIC